MLKFLITIISIFIVAIVLFVAYFLIINRNSDTTVQTLSKILIGLFAIFVLIVFEIFSPLQSETKKVKLLIMTDGKGRTNVFFDELLKIGSEHGRGSQALHIVSLFAPPKNKKEAIQNKMNSVLLDIIEMATLTWLANRQGHVHWDTINEYFEGISGGGGKIDISPNAEKDPLKISIEEIKDLLKENFFQVPRGHLGELFLPSGSKITTERSGLIRTIKISNKYVDEFKIEILLISSGGLTYASLGENIKKQTLKDKSPDSWYTRHFLVNFSAKYNKLRRGSPETKIQRRWINGIMADYYNDFEWSLIKTDLEKFYNQNTNQEEQSR